MAEKDPKEPPKEQPEPKNVEQPPPKEEPAQAKAKKTKEEPKPGTAGPATAGPATTGPATEGPATAGPATAGPATAKPDTLASLFGLPFDSSKQTEEERRFHAPSHICLTIVATLLCPPLGFIAIYFCYQTLKYNSESKWTEAYFNSSITGWLDTVAIILSLGIIYYVTLFT